jgi:carbonic anhydrase/acetyltransferase-like protein (isoleucine patch superfamily)
MKKYELTDETMTVDEVTYHRIRACKDFDVQGYHVKAGDLGGYVESEYNIDQDRNAWVGGLARIGGHAVIRDNARVCGNSHVRGHAVIGGHAWIGDNAWIGGHAVIRDNAWIGDNARIGDNAWIGDNAVIRDNAWIGDNAVIRDNVAISGHAVIGGHAWIGDNAVIGGHAVISGHAVIGGHAWIGDNAEVRKPSHIIVISPIGSRDDCTTFCRSKDNDIIVKCGCFNGNISEFLEKVNKTHGDNKYAAEYRAAAELAKIHIDLEGETE